MEMIENGYGGMLISFINEHNISGQTSQTCGSTSPHLAFHRLTYLPTLPTYLATYLPSYLKKVGIF